MSILSKNILISFKNAIYIVPDIEKEKFIYIMAEDKFSKQIRNSDGFIELMYIYYQDGDINSASALICCCMLIYIYIYTYISDIIRQYQY